MRRIVWSGLDDAGRRDALRRPAQQAGPTVTAAVRSLVDDVRERGDAALRELTARFDGVELDAFEVTPDEIEAAGRGLPASLRDAIDSAAARIRQFHAAGAAMPYVVETAPGVRCERILRPIRRVGLYVPAGSAPLPSTALMLGVPAQLAGCRDVVLCTPPRSDGTADPAVLYAAARCRVGRIYKLGGVQAIAAMAFGAGCIPKCDKLFGPGNAYVTEAKRQVSMLEGGAAIDMPAGPSEVLVIADARANPEFVAADLLSQAEHGPDSQVVLISDAPAMLDEVAAAIERQLAALPRADIARRALGSSRLVEVRSLIEAFEISNEYAPEHLIIAVTDARRWLPHVHAAGSVFLGDWSPEALGDYCSGTNHVLPTSGAARYCGGLNVSSFQIAITVQDVQPTGLVAIGPCAVELASAEGLDAHRLAVALRLKEIAA